VKGWLWLNDDRAQCRTGYCRHRINKQPNLTSSTNDSASGTGAQPDQQPTSALPAGGSDSTAAAAAAPAESPQTSPVSTEQNDQPAVAQTSASASPAVEVVAAKSAPSGVLARTRMWVVGGLLLAGLLILAW